jgi:hypothetical protein
MNYTIKKFEQEGVILRVGLKQPPKSMQLYWCVEAHKNNFSRVRYFIDKKDAVKAYKENKQRMGDLIKSLNFN